MSVKSLLSSASDQKSSQRVFYFHLFFLNYFIYFNWMLITLQYCSGFCNTLTWISHGYTCVPQPESPLPPPSPSHPSRSSQCTGPEHPVLCIKPGLGIYFTYGNILFSMRFSQIIPPSSSPTESKSLFFISISLLLSCIYCHPYHLSKFHIYIYMHQYTVMVFFFLTYFTLYKLQFHPPN